MADLAVFVGPNGSDPRTAIHATIEAFTAPTVGDLLYVGQLWTSRIRKRTFAGVDVNGSPFAAYNSTRPFYLYPNGPATNGRTAAGRAARATAAKNRHAKTGRIGVRTATGIRYESYAAAKAAHGVSGVNLFSMQQGPHMLDAIMVKAGGSESTVIDAEFNSGSNSDINVFMQNQPCSSLQLGFYGDEAGRAKGHNEGTSKLPKREFFALNQQDLELGEKAIAQRMVMRARAGGSGGSSSSVPVAPIVSGPITLDDVGF